MICKNCGTDNVAEALFCENCGSKLEAEAPVAAPAPTPVAAPAPESYAPPAAPAMPVSAPKKKGKGKLVLIIAIIVVLLAGIGVVGWFGFCAEYPWFVDESIIGLGGGEAAPAPVEEKEDEKDKEDKEEEEETPEIKENDIDDVIDTMEKAWNSDDVDMFLEAFPVEISQLAEKNEDVADFFEEGALDMHSAFGDDAEISMVIDKEEPFDDDELEEAEETLNSYLAEKYEEVDIEFTEEVKIEEGSYLTITYTIENDDGTSSEDTLEMPVVKIDGNWYSGMEILE